MIAGCFPAGGVSGTPRDFPPDGPSVMSMWLLRSLCASASSQGKENEEKEGHTWTGSDTQHFCLCFIGQNVAHHLKTRGKGLASMVSGGSHFPARNVYCGRETTHIWQHHLPKTVQKYQQLSQRILGRCTDQWLRSQPPAPTTPTSSLSLCTRSLVSSQLDCAFK